MSTLYDTIVVGSGPAGATVAGELASQGASVLLLERHKLPRYKACGGGLPHHIYKFLNVDIEPVLHDDAHQAIFSYRTQLSFAIKPPAMHVGMVLRDEFDHFLTESAVKRGAKLKDATALLSLREGADHVEVETSRGLFKARYLVGADGASSRVAVGSRLRPQFDYGGAISVEVKIPPRAQAKAQGVITFDVGGIPCGYAWIFPKKDQVSIGVCSSRRSYKGLRRDLDRFMQKHPLLKEGEVLLLKGAPLPFFRAMPKVHTERVLLVGDAASLVDPLSGEGIHYAVESGKYAADTLGLCLQGNADLSHYSGKIKQTIGRELEAAKPLAAAFFTFPQIVFVSGMVNPWVNRLFVELIMGRMSYREIYEKLDKSFWAKLFRVLRRLLFPRATKAYLNRRGGAV